MGCGCVTTTGRTNLADDFQQEVASHLGGTSIVVFLQHPLFVVCPLEREQGQAEFLDGFEAPHPQQILLQRADEALRDAVPFGLPHETRGAVDAEEGDLLLEIVGQISSTRGRDAAAARGRHASTDTAEAFADTLADGLQGLEAGSALGRMQTDARGRAVIDGHKHAGRSLAPGHRGRHVGAPHDVRRLGGDRAVVRLRAMRVAHAVRGLEVVLAHQSAYPLLRGTNPLDPQLCPDFPVPLAMKRRRLEHPANMDHQDLVRSRADGPAAMPQHAVPPGLPPRIHTRPRPRPHTADALHPIRPTGGDRLGATHRVDLRRAKGTPASRWSTFA